MTAMVSLDVETSSEASLQTQGSYRYVEDPSTRILMMAYQLIGDSSRPELWLEGDPVPEKLTFFVNSGYVFSGWNCVAFDRGVYQTLLVERWGFPPISDDNWIDSMHAAAAANLPRGLAPCAKAIGFPFEEDLKDHARVKRITNATNTPIPFLVSDILRDQVDIVADKKLLKAAKQEKQPIVSQALRDDLQWLANRCVQDVEMEAGVLQALPPWPQMEPWRFMPYIDRRINDRGILLDVKLAEGLALAAEREKRNLNEKLSKLTNGAVSAVTKVEVFKQWLIHNGVELPDNTIEDEYDEFEEDDNPETEEDEAVATSKGARESPWKLRKSDVADLIARDDVPEVCRLALAVRSEGNKVSASKFRAMLARVSSDGRMRGSMSLGGAQQTLRWASPGANLYNTVRDVFGNADEVAGTHNLNTKTDKAAIQRLQDDWLREAIEIGCTGDPEVIRARYETTRKDAQGRLQPAGVMTWISRMTRRTLSAQRGKVLLNGDYSQIEARITDWLAQQTDMLDAWGTKQDVYKVAAEGIFHIPKDELTKGQRQSGKVAKLACIAEGSLVTTDRGLIPIERVPRNCKVWDGVEWVAHDGPVFRGVKETIVYDGLEATPDHPVFVGGSYDQLTLANAAAGSHSITRLGGNRELKTGKKKYIDAVIKQRRVWDIFNAGPRHRYYVSNRLVHNCGFGGGMNALLTMALNQGVLLTAEESKTIVRNFREVNDATQKYWYATDDAAASAVMYYGREFPVPPLGLVSYFMDPAGFDCLCCRLPSGRLLRYWAPRLRQGYWDKARTRPKKRLSLSGLTVKGQVTFRRPLYHTILCLSGETRVLTNDGVKKLAQINKHDMVWDGLEWVSHDGLICQGIKWTLDFGGIYMTPDHKVLHGASWKEARYGSYDDATRTFQQSYRIPSGIFDGKGIPRTGRASPRSMASGVYMQSQQRNVGRAPTSWNDKKLRVSEIGCSTTIKTMAGNTWDVRPSSILGLAVNVRSLQAIYASGMEKLRRAWHYSMFRVEQQFRSVLGRHGTVVSTGTVYRAATEQRGLLKRELLLGHSATAKQEQTQQCRFRYPMGTYTASRSGAYDWRERIYAALSDSAQLSGRAAVREIRREEPVYDIQNAGPNKRFTVVGADGRFIIVSNCENPIQAIAADMLGHGLDNTDRNGLNTALHVYDSLAAEVDEDKAESLVSIFRECMLDQPSWTYGLPLDCDIGIGARFG